MLLIEQEAREKWCPAGGKDQETGCIGSACMAWRWAWKKPGTDCDGFTNSTETCVAHGYQCAACDQRRGYCGLAGEGR